MSVTFTLAPGTNNEKSLTEDQITQYNPIKTHTGKGDCAATVVEDRNLDAYAQRQDRVNILFNNSVEWTGYLVNVSHNKNTAQTNLTFDGIAKRLEETRPDYDALGGSLSYSNTRLDSAIDDYWDRTPFSNHSVTNQTPDSVASNEQVQSASTQTEWENITTIGANEPLGVQNGNFSLLQSLFFSEGENNDFGTLQATRSDSAYSESSAALLQTNADDPAYNFDLDYDIPDGEVWVALRMDFLSNSNHEAFDVEIDGTTVLSFGRDLFSSGLDWTSIQEPTNIGGLSSGSHTIRINVTTNTASDDMALDALAVYDDRYSYTFDNSVDGDNHLSGPELYPDGIGPFAFATQNVSYNITAADVSSSWVDSDTSGSQSIQVSNDGSTWLPSNGNENNTNSISVSFSTFGREITTRVDLDRYGSRTTSSPTSGFNGQSIDSYTLTVDGNDLVIIDELELSRDHFTNLKTLHNYGDFLWVMEHDSSDITNITVTSFQDGEETRSAPSGFDDPANQTSQIKAENYYNVIYLQGAEDANGNRPSAEVKADQSVINNDGREISPGVLRDPDITTEAGATFRARSLLNTAQSNNDLIGSITVPPQDNFTDPGFARPVDFSGDGTTNNKTVEEVSFSEANGNVQVTYQFALPNDLSENINQLKRGQRSIGDRV